MCDVMLLKPEIRLFRSIAVIALTLLLGCDGNFQSEDTKTLEWFKTTTGSGLSNIIGGAEIQKCVGISGSVEWKIFQGKDMAENLRVIEANVANKGKKARFQWAVNRENKNFELTFAEIDGEAQSRLSLALGLMTICSL